MTGLRDDGYHLLDSLVVFTDFGDDLRATPSNTLTLAVDGPFAEGVPTDQRNLVLKAANLLRELRSVTAGAAIHLTKNLPHGGGIGGGSSDAACTLHLLADLWNVPVLTTDEALPLGADVPVCLCAPDATIMHGIGEDLTRAPFQPDGWLVLVNPGVVVPTGTVFDMHDTLYEFDPNGAAPMDGITDMDGFEDWLHRHRNDLTKVARDQGIAPVIGDVLSALDGNVVADMSGSGSTCWGLYRDKQTAEVSAKRIADDHPDWWVKATRIAS